MSTEIEKSRWVVSRLILAILLQGRFSASIKRELIQCIIPSGISGGKISSTGMVPPPAVTLSNLFSGVSAESWKHAAEELERAHRNGVWVLPLTDDAYPASLRVTSDPPLLLFGRGAPRWKTVSEWMSEGRHSVFNSTPSFGIVGTRRATPYGQRMAFRLAESVACAGGTVVSGLAMGIDAAAHEAALTVARKRDTTYSAGIAVLGSGLLNIYPRENLYLAAGLLEANGVLISEYGVSAPPQQHFFPERNRIISGLSEAVIVVEAPRRSGAMITARLALEQGREVGACPGLSDSPGSEGPHALLRQGAHLVANPDDLTILSERFARHFRKPKQSRRRERMKDAQITMQEKCALETLEQEIASRVLQWLARHGATDVESLCAHMETSPTVLRRILPILEIEELIQISPEEIVTIPESVDTQGLSHALCGSTLPMP